MLCVINYVLRKKYKMEHYKLYCINDFVICISCDTQFVKYYQNTQLIKEIELRLEFGFNNNHYIYLKHDDIYILSREFQIIFNCITKNVKVNRWLSIISKQLADSRIDKLWISPWLCPIHWRPLVCHNIDNIDYQKTIPDMDHVLIIT